MAILDEEDLLENYFLQKFNDSDFVKLENKISMGQTIILKEHCQLVSKEFYLNDRLLWSLIMIMMMIMKIM